MKIIHVEVDEHAYHRLKILAAIKKQTIKALFAELIDEATKEVANLEK